MLDPFRDCGEDDSNRWTDDRTDLDGWAVCIKWEEKRVFRARAALQKLREQLRVAEHAAQGHGGGAAPNPDAGDAAVAGA
eukprot:6123095-Lingulodinium_polyedra.AAC.1